MTIISKLFAFSQCLSNLYLKLSFRCRNLIIWCAFLFFYATRFVTVASVYFVFILVKLIRLAWYKVAFLNLINWCDTERALHMRLISTEITVLRTNRIAKNTIDFEINAINREKYDKLWRYSILFLKSKICIWNFDINC